MQQFDICITQQLTERRCHLNTHRNGRGKAAYNILELGVLELKRVRLAKNNLVLTAQLHQQRRPCGEQAAEFADPLPMTKKAHGVAKLSIDVQLRRAARSFAHGYARAVQRESQ